MKKYSVLQNKYTLPIIILLLLLSTDIFLNQGMTRFLLPENFPDRIVPQIINPVKATLVAQGIHWKKAVNSKEAMAALPATVAGFEVDVYFDTTINVFYVYHDSTQLSTQRLDGLLGIYKQNKLTASVWLDFKNLSAANEQPSLLYLLKLREQFSLHNKIIVESTAPQYLQSFNQSNLFTSYYTPFFNPYTIGEEVLKIYADSISSTLKKYNVAALSGYYFQVPALKKYFPSYPLLSWSAPKRFSLISFLFQIKLERAYSPKVLLFP